MSKRVEVRAKGENKIGIFVDKANADLLGGTESALRLEDEGLRAREEREMRGGNFDSQKEVERAILNT